MNQLAAIEYIRRKQLPEGNFAAYASATSGTFKIARRQATIFPTALILDCLQTVPGTADMCQKAAAYLRTQVGPDGAWNYWERHSPASHAEPYPDDLDDTACVIAALSCHDDQNRGGDWGKFARLLVLAEQSAGGPYNTWLVDTQRAPQWRQVDLAVNANIGYALARHAVCPPGLRNFIETAIASDNYDSAYYVGQIPGLYFISRWYRGDRLDSLRLAVAQRLTAAGLLSALEQALLLGAACQLGLERHQLQPLAEQLRGSGHHDYWPAAALYVDPVYNGRQHYGGSTVLTTAYVLQALHMYDRMSIRVGAGPTHPQLPLARLRRSLAGTLSPALRRRYMRTARRICRGPTGQQIYAAGSVIAQAGSWRPAASVLKQLDLAGLHGWIAYTLYDDVLDGALEIGAINTANAALRQSYRLFLQATDQPLFAHYVQQVFDTIDSANDWELRNARITTKQPRRRINRLPDYGDYAQLAQKSLGHSLAACAVAASHYGTMEHPTIHSLQRFYRHFLIARQLNDDAHDWEADLSAGQLSAVVCLLLNDYDRLPYTLNLSTDIDRLRQHFWQHTLDDVTNLIRTHLAAAEQALDNLGPDAPVSIFRGWLHDLEAAVLAAEHGRDQAQQFITAYETSYA